MTSWSSRMAAAVLAHEARANDANSASSSVEVSRMGDIGTIGTIGTDLQKAADQLATDLSVLSAQLVAAVPPCPATVAERAALIEEGDYSGEEADSRALAEYGLASWGELADAHAAVIRAAVDCVQHSLTSDGSRLASVTREFIATDNWRCAVEHGWSLLELFGVHAYAPGGRIEAWGAISALALSSLAPVGVEQITADRIVINCRSSNVKLVHRPGNPNLSASVVWWECAALLRANAILKPRRAGSTRGQRG